jgi:hypothetical protein
MQARVHLTGVGVADGRAAMSTQLLGLRQQLSRMVSVRAPSGPTTSGHPHRTAAHHVPARTHSLLATSGGQSAGGQTDHLAGAAARPTAQARPAPTRSTPESSRPRPDAPVERAPTGIKQPGITLPWDSDRGVRTDRWHIRAERHAGGWDRADGWHRDWHRHR